MGGYGMGMGMMGGYGMGMGMMGGLWVSEIFSMEQGSLPLT